VPLCCDSDDGLIVAIDFNDEEAWLKLRELNRQERHLRMPCCHADVVLKRSKLGTRFFAHARAGKCSTAPESMEHLLAKEQIALSARRAGWLVAIERSGATPTGVTWKADVLASKGGANSIAFEVQWSKQTIDETERRQRVYQESGIRALWFFQQHDVPVSEATPAVRLVFDPSDNRFEVWLPSAEYLPGFVNARTRNDAHNWSHKIELGDFVVGALSGHFRFGFPAKTAVPLVLEGAENDCWKCGRPTKIVTSLRLLGSAAIGGAFDLDASLDDFDHRPEYQRLLRDALPKAILAQRGIGELKSRYSKTVGESYLSNGCVHCDALQGRFFDQEVAWEAHEIHRTEIQFDATWREVFSESSGLDRWWLETTQTKT
jgi:Competence protein CoiA-like family